MEALFLLGLIVAAIALVVLWAAVAAGGETHD